MTTEKIDSYKLILDRAENRLLAAEACGKNVSYLINCIGLARNILNMSMGEYLIQGYMQFVLKAILASGIQEKTLLWMHPVCTYKGLTFKNFSFADFDISLN